MKMKSGVPYESFRDKLRPFDCVFFCGGDFVSSTIRYIERQRLGAGEFSHVGVIVTSDVLDHPNIVPGRRYILESTATGLLGCGVKNIDGKAAFCVQITDFDALVEAYDRSSRTRIAVAHIADDANPINLLGVAEAKRRTQDFWERMRGRSYQFNLFSMLSAIFPFFRGARKQVERLVGGHDWVFCSELVFQFYCALGMYDAARFNSKDVVPQDLLGFDEDGIPLCLQTPPTYILSRKWSRKQARRSRIAAELVIGI